MLKNVGYQAVVGNNGKKIPWMLMATVNCCHMSVSKL